MPLKRGKSDETVKTNIKKLVHEYDKGGTVGSSHPKNKKKAVKPGCGDFAQGGAINR